jgi:serine protease AprX
VSYDNDWIPVRKPSVAPAVLLALALVAASALTLAGAGRKHRAHLSDDLLVHEAHKSHKRTRVIIPGTRRDLDALAARHHLKIIRYLKDAAVFLADSAELSRVAADEGVSHLSGDLPMRSGMSVSNLSTAADQVRAGTPGLAGIDAVAPVTGQGITVAVIDSGISPHAALANKVIANVSFVTGDLSVTDAFGHGTHVAGIIAGSGSAAATVTNLYTGGIAPGAKLVNVRVLGANGAGFTSDVLAGIQWAVANRTIYNIRVINLSLGHSVAEASATDPLHKAVMEASLAGIVVVVSAGNSGRSPSAAPVLGSISSPANSPYAITVGALNTWGTVGRSDDTITSYSSRGPTRFDLGVKPDLAAPGNKIVSLEAAGAALAAQYPYLHVAGGSTNAYLQLSGTSMAAPMVSGAIALLLEGTPGLSPTAVKFALQAGATYMSDAGLMAGGTGSVNFWASRKIAANGPTDPLPTALVGGLVAAPSGAAFWDAGTLAGRLYSGVGSRLLSVLDLPLVWKDPSLLKFGDLNLIGLTNPLVTLTSKPLAWGHVVAGWTTAQQIIWGESIYNPVGEQIIWGETAFDPQGEQIIWGEAVMSSPDPQ